jgi:hypothetical protein
VKHRLRFLLASLILVTLGAPAIVRAGAPVRVEFDDRVTLPSRDDVRHIVELELRAPLSNRKAPDVTLVRVRPVADRPSQVEIVIDDPLTGKSLARTVDLLALGPGGSTRLLALAVIELITASWSELETNPRPIARPVGEAASGDDRRAALAAVYGRSLAQRQVQIGAFGIVDGTFGGASILAGGGVRIVPALPHQLALPIDLLVEHGARGFDAGEVTIDVLAADVALAYRRQWSRLGLRVGGGARGGAVRYSGRPSGDLFEGSTIWVPWIGPLATVSGLVVPTRRLAIELIVTAGYAFAGTSARVIGTSEVSTVGPWVGAALCIGMLAGR